MIRIDEIYDNVFLPYVKQHINDGNFANSNYRIGLHWFEPFGTTNFANMVSKPPVYWSMGKDPHNPINSTRIIFWDQEPLHLDRFNSFIEPFANQYTAKFTRLVTSEYQSADVEVRM